MVVLKGCQSITNEQLNEQELEYTRTTISPLQDQHVLSLLDEVVTGKRAKSSTHLLADFGNIDLTEAVKVVEHYDGTVRYTFEVDGFNGVSFENLIIKETKEGRLSGYLLRYEPDMQWLYEQQGNFNFDAFTGVLRVVNMDGSEVLQADFEGGKSTRFARTASKKAKANTEDCNNTQGGGSTGSGGNSGEGDDGTGGDSTGGGSTGGDSTDGGSTGGDSGSGSNGGDGSDGGGSDGCDWYVVDNTLIIEGCEVGGGLGDPGDDPANDDIVAKANTACEDGLGEFDEGECIDDDCPPDPVGTVPPTSIFDEYSGDGFDDPDFSSSNYTGPTTKIPTTIKLDNGQEVNVTFGITKSDQKSANNPVKPSLVNAIKFALNDASKIVKITHIHISATTNGAHHPESNHYKNKAVDISRINNQYIFDIQNSNLVKSLQEAFDKFPEIRENFGPAFKHKFGQPYNVGGHNDHIHISVN